MRELNECKAEVFRRSDNRIKERRRSRNRILAMCVPLCLVLTIFSVMMLPGMLPAGMDKAPEAGNQSGNLGGVGTGDPDGNNADLPGNGATGSVDEFSFSLTWNTYGISSYDSATGKLVKTTDATNPEDYVTTLQLDGTQLFEIWELLWELDIETYPDEYDPQGGELSSEPSMTLILTLRDGDKVKTVRAEDIALSYESDDPKGQKFLDTCKGIRDILTATEEWKALPEYEFFYD